MIKKSVLFFAIVFSVFFQLKAAYLENVPQVLVQPNGDTLRCFATGDEYYHYLHDADGYTIVLDEATGYFVYADKVDSRLVPTAYVAGTVTPASVGLQPRLNISAEEWLARRQAREATMLTAEPSRNTRYYNPMNHGTINNIVIFIRFSNETDFTNNPTTVNNMFNNSADSTVSMYNYFKSVSYNQLNVVSHFYPTPDSTTIYSYQDVHPRSYYQPYSSTNPNGYHDGEQAAREHLLLKNAVDYIADLVPTSLNLDNDNDGNIDNIVFVVRGNVGDWNDLLWPHMWVLYSQNAYINGKKVNKYNLQLADNSTYFSVSTLCHEMNHTLGAPDLYHYYNATNATSAGPWDLMHSNATPPQNMGAYMKYRYGTWIDDIPLIDSCGTYTLYSVGASSTQNCYKIAGPTPNEFFVLEYRNKNDFFDRSIPRSGLLIYRINNNFSGNASYNGTDQFDEVYIYRPNHQDSRVYEAPFSSSYGRDAFNPVTNPNPLMTNGAIFGNLFIHQITEVGGDSIQFTYCEENYIMTSASLVELGSGIGASGQLTVYSDLGWTVSGGCDWLMYTPHSGNGQGTVTFYTTRRNRDYEDRECTLVFENSAGVQRIVTVVQKGLGYILEAQLDISNLPNVPEAEARMIVHSNVNWNMTVNNNWLEWDGATGIHPGETHAYDNYYDTVYFHPIDTNDVCRRRIAYIRLSASRYGDTSATPAEVAFVNLPIYQQGVYSHFYTDVTSANFDNIIGDAATINVTATNLWEVASLPNWLGANEMNGDGDGVVVFTTQATNNSATARNATVMLRDECGTNVQIRVSQARGVLDVAEQSVTLDRTAGSAASVSLSCTGDWHVVAGSVADWLEILPPDGSFDASVTVRALTDNDSCGPRTDTIRFMYGLQRDTLIVSQLGYGEGIAEQIPQGISLFPNPVANGQLTIVVENADSYGFSLLDINGREVLAGQLQQGNNALNLSEMAAGTYLLRLVSQSSGEVSVSKIIRK